jgi:hypothetical protein
VPKRVVSAVESVVVVTEISTSMPAQYQPSLYINSHHITLKLAIQDRHTSMAMLETSLKARYASLALPGTPNQASTRSWRGAATSSMSTEAMTIEARNTLLMSTGGLIHLRTHSAMRFTMPTIVTSSTIRHANGAEPGGQTFTCNDYLRST